MQRMPQIRSWNDFKGMPSTVRGAFAVVSIVGAGRVNASDIVVGITQAHTSSAGSISSASSLQEGEALGAPSSRPSEQTRPTRDEVSISSCIVGSTIDTGKDILEALLGCFEIVVGRLGVETVAVPPRLVFWWGCMVVVGHAQ